MLVVGVVTVDKKTLHQKSVNDIHDINTDFPLIIALESSSERYQVFSTDVENKK